MEKKPSKHINHLASLMHDEWRAKKIEQGWHLPENCPNEHHIKMAQEIVEPVGEVSCGGCHTCVNSWDKLTDKEKELPLQNSRIAYSYFKPYFNIIAILFVILIAWILWQANENQKKSEQIRLLNSDTLRYSQKLDSIRNDFTLLMQPTYENVKSWAEFYGINHVDVFLRGGEHGVMRNRTPSHNSGRRRSGSRRSATVPSRNRRRTTVSSGFNVNFFRAHRNDSSKFLHR